MCPIGNLGGARLSELAGSIQPFCGELVKSLSSVITLTGALYEETCHQIGLEKGV